MKNIKWGFQLFLLYLGFLLWTFESLTGWEFQNILLFFYPLLFVDVLFVISRGAIWIEDKIIQLETKNKRYK